MKKLVLALTAVAAFTGSASAADLAARPYTKAPAPVAPAYNWTGFYIFGGQGGDGWYGTVGAGYDWQVNPTWVVGVFGDGQFGSLKGTIQDPVAGWTSSVKMQDAWAAGVRVGYLVAPNVLSYVNGGYSGSHWSGTTLLGTFSGLPVGTHTNSFNRNGWFVGGGVENSLNIFGIAAPGWFMKTEYRAAYYDRRNINELVDGTNALVGRDIAFKHLVQTISTSLVYRFNWSGPVVA